MTPVLITLVLVIAACLGAAFGYQIGKHGSTNDEAIARLHAVIEELEHELRVKDTRLNLWKKERDLDKEEK
jgi:thymidylate synthase